MKGEGEKFAPIIFVGMHRSGTTMISEFLEEIGVFMGNKKGAVNNESLFFQRLNDWIFKVHNIYWDNPSGFVTNKHLNSNVLRVIQSQLSNARRIEYLGLKWFFLYGDIRKLRFPWGWKDPRTSILLDFWMQVFPNAKILHVYRHPIDVASSLSKRESKEKKNYKSSFRDRMKEFFRSKVLYQSSPRLESIEEGIRLWDYYLKKILDVSETIQPSQVLQFSYEDFLEDPVGHMTMISEFVGIQVGDSKIVAFANKIDTTRKLAYRQDSDMLKYEDIVNKSKVAEKLGY